MPSQDPNHLLAPACLCIPQLFDRGGVHPLEARGSALGACAPQSFPPCRAPSAARTQTPAAVLPFSLHACHRLMPPSKPSSRPPSQPSFGQTPYAPPLPCTPYPLPSCAPCRCAGLLWLVLMGPVWRITTGLAMAPSSSECRAQLEGIGLARNDCFAACAAAVLFGCCRLRARHCPAPPPVAAASPQAQASCSACTCEGAHGSVGAHGPTRQPSPPPLPAHLNHHSAGASKTRWSRAWRNEWLSGRASHLCMARTCRCVFVCE